MFSPQFEEIANMKPKISASTAVVFAILAVFLAVGCSVATRSAEPENAVVPVAVDPTPAGRNGDMQTAVFAGGCFWGVEAVFEHVKGVKDVVSGYAGGDLKSPSYDQVSEGNTGHAESVKVTFDPSVVSYEQLLQIFFSVAHDPTQLNRQGPDSGTQYRSAIFFADEAQRRSAQAYIERLTAEKSYSNPIVTELAALKVFYPAEAYHQDYLKHHPKEPYIVINDQPKVAALKAKYPEIYVEK
jgi:peptide-methionine (S)-S-oxide reductase